MNATLTSPAPGNALGKRPYLVAVWTTSTLTVAHVGVDGVLGGMTALGPMLQARLDVGEAALAALVAMLWIASSLSQPLFGLLADRVGARSVAAFGAVAAGVLLGVVAVAPSAPVAILLLVGGGLGSGAFHPAAAAIVHAVPERRHGLALSVFGAGGAVGLAAGPVVVLAIIAAAGTPSAAWTALAGLIAAALLLATPRPPAVPVAVRFAPRHLPLVLRGPVGMITLVVAFASLPAMTFAAAVPVWLVDAGQPADAALIGWTLAAYNIAAAAGGIGAITATRWLRRAAVVAATLLASLPVLYLMFAVPVGSIAYFAAVIAAGALGNAALPLLIVVAQDLAPYAVATASGLVGAAVGVAALAYVAVGVAQEAIGVTAAMRLAYLAVLPAAALTVALARRYPALARAAPTRLSLVCPCAPCLCGSCPRSQLNRY